ncbi:kinase-like protein [Trichocladium antarcticum]|uniref:non-specific serine/threonine protein kinase n=1 Tax=Trichocladium antarcticum TaxID=1450529 RepID=A0AAN6ZCS4_9PEZI|nr:kinase-like protein [Trichocladium antarcticum]
MPCCVLYSRADGIGNGGRPSLCCRDALSGCQGNDSQVSSSRRQSQRCFLCACLPQMPPVSAQKLPTQKLYSTESDHSRTPTRRDQQPDREIPKQAKQKEPQRKMAPPHTDEVIRKFQRELTDYFSFWRAGQGRKYNRQDRHAAAAKIEFPKKGKWPGFPRGQPPPSRRLHRIQKVWDEKGPSNKYPAARQVNSQMAARMQVAGFRFVKILGWGGLGVASLFEAVDPGRGTKKVVCKMDLRRDVPCVKGEIEMHLKTAGAKHVIQRVVLARPSARGAAAEPPPAVAGRAPGYRQPRGAALRAALQAAIGGLLSPEARAAAEEDARQKLDEDQGVLFIEYMERGRLDDHIAKVAIKGTHFPNEVLWQVFDCLFRAVIGMAYPNAFQPVGSNPRTDDISQVSETCYGLPLRGGFEDTIVHFDIDPLNILVGDFDQGDHNLVPVIKVADLGVAKLFGLMDRFKTVPMWSARKCGKAHIMTPEQFSEEWDYIDSTPAAAQSQVAGNYNWWTNLYQIGLVMWTMITLHHTEQPPVADELALANHDGTITPGVFSYGGILLHPSFAHVDAELRHLVMLCLNYDPTTRPSMAQISEALDRRVCRFGPVTPEAEYAQQWAHNLFGGPPPPDSRPVSGQWLGGLKGWNQAPPPPPPPAAPAAAARAAVRGGGRFGGADGNDDGSDGEATLVAGRPRRRETPIDPALLLLGGLRVGSAGAAGSGKGKGVAGGVGGSGGAGSGGQGEKQKGSTSELDKRRARLKDMQERARARRAPRMGVAVSRWEPSFMKDFSNRGG